MEDNLISESDNKKRFLLRKPIRLLTLFLLYAVIMVEAMVVNTFNSNNASIRASLRVTEKTHAIFTFIYHLGQFISSILVIVVMRIQDQRKGTVLYSVYHFCCGNVFPILRQPNDYYDHLFFHWILCHGDECLYYFMDRSISHLLL